MSVAAEQSVNHFPMQRWLVLFSGLVLQIILGGIYAWSEFAVVLAETCSLSKTQCSEIFGVAIACFAFAMTPAGAFLHKFGARITAGIGAVLYLAGFLTASVSEGNHLWLLASFAIIGVGIGFGYVCPLNVSMKWFPQNRGLVTGVAVGGFGAGAIFMSMLAQYLLRDKGFDVFEAFFIIGVVSGILALISSQLLSEPLLPEHFEDETQDKKMRSLFVNQDFILIVIGMFAGTFAGLMIIGNLKQIMLMSGIEDSAATLCITLFAVGNISGRVIWGQITDKLQPWPTIVLANAFFALSLLILLVTENNAPMLLLASLAIGAGFGSCFVIYASAISKIFGIRFFARLYPLCFGAYGIAALTGPLAGGWLADYTGSFKTGILVSMKMLIVLIIFVVVVQNWERIPSARRRKTANA